MQNKVLSIKNKLAGAVAGATMALTGAATQVFCAPSASAAGGTQVGGLNVTPVTVNANVDGQTLISRVVSILCAAIALVGVLSLINGYSDYTAAKKDENSTGMTKAANKMAISLVEVAAPAVVAFLFT